MQGTSTVHLGMSIDDSRDKSKPQYDRHPELHSPQEKRRRDREKEEEEEESNTLSRHSTIVVEKDDYLRLRVMLHEGQEIAVRIVGNLTQKERGDSVWNGEANRRWISCYCLDLPFSIDVLVVRRTCKLQLVACSGSGAPLLHVHNLVSSFGVDAPEEQPRAATTSESKAWMHGRGVAEQAEGAFGPPAATQAMQQILAAAPDEEQGQHAPTIILPETNDLSPVPKRPVRVQQAAILHTVQKKMLGYNKDTPHAHQEYFDRQIDPDVKKRLEQEQQAAQQCIGLLDTIIQIMVRACSLLASRAMLCATWRANVHACMCVCVCEQSDERENDKQGPTVEDTRPHYHLPGICCCARVCGLYPSVRLSPALQGSIIGVRKLHDARTSYRPAPD